MPSWVRSFDSLPDSPKEMPDWRQLDTCLHSHENCLHEAWGSSMEVGRGWDSFPVISISFPRF